MNAPVGYSTVLRTEQTLRKIAPLRSLEFTSATEAI
jgi:hypothetical protein